ncbi:modular FeS cluster scaffolding protein NifU [Hypnocyclicus thermotrophus]|uniref:Modular FeS cluster scaffolding protein NifU n=1 Tax=Hypnocyclicus thermotrophus TaxID=1627895 RepID=A0AA46I5F2_9FUSO|nr:SUF system NifU family Fe-S cluster assembly protein [Hypnocyclicus thermotrophus]TDT69883.1 modular FeS cluster scaffolding protein NifU [Hypnocyclicus thermotrophus]
MDYNKIYTSLIMEHNKSGHNKREIKNADYIERGHNPNCGDDITVQLKIKDDKIVDGAFIGIGCAISQASASILFDIINGKNINEAKHIVESYLKMIKKEEISEEDKEKLEDAVILENISNMPARVKCATLAWNGVKIIFNKI